MIIHMSIPQKNRQKGFILITTLVLMVMLTVLALIQVSNNSTQTRMATNSTDTEISFEKTEGALNEAVNKMIGNSYSSISFIRDANGLYVFNPDNPPIWGTVDWNSGTDVITSFGGSSGLTASYIIEQLPSVVQPGQNMKSSTRIYRITGRTVSGSGNFSTLLQSTLQIQQ